MIAADDKYQIINKRKSTCVCENHKKAHIVLFID